jgi:kynurenine formamidase
MHHIQPGERVLFKTVNSLRCWQTDDFVEDFVYIAHEAAQYLATIGVQTVGVDYLSVGGYRVDGQATHQALLAAGIWIIEGLDLSQSRPGTYDLVCLPLRIVGGDGAPARGQSCDGSAPMSTRAPSHRPQPQMTGRRETAGWHATPAKHPATARR